jgi:TonB family protein
VPPEKARYYRHIKDIVRQNWVPPLAALDNTLEAHFMITIEPDGHVSASKLLKSSGNNEFDISVERAVNKSTFPALPPVFEGKADRPAFVFSLRELQQRP